MCQMITNQNEQVLKVLKRFMLFKSDRYYFCNKYYKSEHAVNMLGFLFQIKTRWKHSIGLLILRNNFLITTAQREFNF